MRLTRTLILGVVLGVATSVGAAWFLAWMPTPLRFDGFGKRRAREASRDPFPLKWYAMRECGLGVTRVTVMVDTGSEPPEPYEAAFEQIAGSAMVRDALRRNADRLFTRMADSYDYSLTFYGWPFPAFCSEGSFSKDRAWMRRLMSSGPEPLPRSAREPTPPEPPEPQFPEPADPFLQRWAFQVRGHQLPTRPLWLGLTADSTLYGALWAALLVGVPWSRRFIRSHRGQCARCGYDRAGLAIDAQCPECGGAPARSRSA